MTKEDAVEECGCPFRGADANPFIPAEPTGRTWSESSRLRRRRQFNGVSILGLPLSCPAELEQDRTKGRRGGLAFLRGRRGTFHQGGELGTLPFL